MLLTTGLVYAKRIIFPVRFSLPTFSMYWYPTLLITAAGLFDWSLTKMIKGKIFTERQLKVWNWIKRVGMWKWYILNSRFLKYFLVFFWFFWGVGECYYFLIYFGIFVFFLKLKETTLLKLFNTKYLFTSKDVCITVTCKHLYWQKFSPDVEETKESSQCLTKKPIVIKW